MIGYSLVGFGPTETLVVMIDGEPVPVSPQHANYTRIKTYLTNQGDDPSRVRELLDARTYIATGLQKLSDRVVFDGEQLTFDGDVVDNALSRYIVRALRQGNDAELRPAVRFMEHLAQNPSSLSRLHLWKWLRDRDFTLTTDGHIIGYKAVRGPDNLSIHGGSNRVQVDGVVHTGRVPYPVGKVVEMARSEVDPSREHWCSAGLHVGTWDYARDFGGYDGKILTVSVNPRDVVAVPADCDDQKMRVCRLTVLEVTDEPHDAAIFTNDELDDGEGDYGVAV